MLPIDSPGEGGGSGSGPITGGSETANITGKNLREGTNVTLRPRVLTSRHLYNLRNQGWSAPKPSFDGGTTPVDLISQFTGASGGAFPANADYINAFVYANTNSDGDKFVVRFNAKDCVANPIGTAQAPMGYFIIDALSRGASRKQVFAQMMAQYPQNTYNIDTLPADETPGGPSVVAEYAGRVFYGGFPGALNDGDSSSPKMSSYVLFSSLVQDASSIYRCYQAADPTSPDSSDLVDTDGGFIRIDGAYGICAMQSIQTGLVILAENGAWTVSGGASSGFTATNYQVTKITTAGCVSPGSVVVVGNAVFYWSRDGIYTLTTNEYGDFVANNITRKTLKTLYNSIASADIKTSQGVYDEFEQKIKWVYGNRKDSTIKTTELILDVTNGVYSKYTIQDVSSSGLPAVIGGVNVNPFSQPIRSNDVIISDGSNVIDSNNDGVQVSVTAFDDTLGNIKDVQYLVITAYESNIQFTFGNYSEPNHYDWVSFDGVGVDAKSYLLTGALNGGDTQRKKDIVYMTTHFNQTETGLVDDGTGDGDLTLANQSSCIMTTQWDWTNSANSNKWSQPQQLYRLRNVYYPDSPDKFDSGYSVVETRTKVRGYGKAVSILFESEPGKHMELLGWSMNLGVNGNV